MNKFLEILKKFNSLKNFQYRFAFYVGLVVILGDMFLFKRYWIDDLWSLLMLPVVAYILGCCICAPAWIMADSNKQVENLIEKEVIERERQEEPS